MAVIIFDFDGTVANTFDYTVDFLSREAGVPVPKKTVRAAMHGLSMAGIARHLGIPWRRLPRLFFQGQAGDEPGDGEHRTVRRYGGSAA